MSINQIQYFQSKNIFILKMEGELRFFLSPVLEDVLKLIDFKKIKQLIFDLSQAVFIDSTILGMMVHYALKDEHEKHFLNFKPIIVCDNMDLINILTRIGFDTFFEMKKHDKRIQVSTDKYTFAPTINNDKNVLQEHVRHAHLVLGELHPSAGFEQVVGSLKKKF